MIARQVATLPNYLAVIAAQAGGAVAAKMNENELLVEHRSRRSVGVRFVMVLLNFSIFEKQLVMFDLAAFEVNANSVHFIPIRSRSGQPDFIAQHNR